MLVAHGQLKKLATLKTALGKREKLLLAILGLTAAGPGVMAGSGAIQNAVEGASPLNPLFGSDNPMKGYYYDKSNEAKNALDSFLKGSK